MSEMSVELLPMPEPAINKANPAMNAYAFGCHADQMTAYAEANVAKLREENEALRKDAERYRWLREGRAESAVPAVFMCNEDAEAVHGLSGGALDAAIDAARGGE